MKWMIASDLHGSALYGGAMTDAYRREQADRLLLLGDLLYHGPRNDLPDGYAPKTVIDQLNALDCVYAVRGNCEAEVDQMVLRFPVLADYCLLFCGTRAIYATHGHSTQTLPLRRGDILLQGHTHVPLCEERDGILHLNPGSVSIPKEDSPRGYMTLQGTVFSWKTLDGTEWKRFDTEAL